MPVIFTCDVCGKELKSDDRYTIKITKLQLFGDSLEFYEDVYLCKKDMDEIKKYLEDKVR